MEGTPTHQFLAFLFTNRFYELAQISVRYIEQ